MLTDKWRTIMVYGDGAGVIKSSSIDENKGIHKWVPPAGDEDVISHVLPLGLYVHQYGPFGYQYKYPTVSLKILLGENRVHQTLTQDNEYRQRTAANIANKMRDAGRGHNMRTWG